MGELPVRIGRWTVWVPHDGISDLRVTIQPNGRPVAWIARAVAGSPDLGVDALDVTEEA